jgi:hypothetical protein
MQLLSDEKTGNIELLAIEWEAAAELIRQKLDSFPKLAEMDASEHPELVERGRGILLHMAELMRHQLEVRWTVILDEVIEELKVPSSELGGSVQEP